MPAAFATIAAGDVVCGADGVPMNVRAVGEDHVLCTWMDERGTRQVRSFARAGLHLMHALSHLDERGRPHGEAPAASRTTADGRPTVDPGATQPRTAKRSVPGERSGSGARSLWPYLAPE